MGVNDPAPPRDPDPGPDAEHTGMDAFQSVLDAFDAARAELHEGHELRRLAEDPPPPPPRLDLPPPAPRHSWPRPADIESEHPAPFSPEQPPEPPEPPSQGRLRPGGYRASVSHPATTGPPPPEQEEAPPPRSHARARGRGRRRLTTRRHTGAAGVFGMGALSGFIIAFSILVNDNENAAPPIPDTFSGQPDQSRPDTPLPDGPQPGGGVLRQGDSGDAVFELQKRLLQIPEIYENAETDGRYDVDVTAAVARFQQWYGVRGDGYGVYGDSTRRDLESRTR